MAPRNVNNDNEHDLWLKPERTGPQRVTMRQPKTRFRVGDHVRLSKVKRVFEKGYLPNWTEEILTVTQVLDTEPEQYKASDYGGNRVSGSFYGAELQKVALPDRYAVERIIRRRVEGRMH